MPRPKYLLLSTYKTLQNIDIHQSHYRKQISIANLLQRYGFPSSLLHNFLSKNCILIQSDLKDMENSLCVLLFAFKIPQKDLVSLVCDCPGVLDCDFLRNWELGFSKLGLSRVSPLLIKSVLEHSRRFQVDADGFSRKIEVLRGLGFNDGTLVRVLEGFPGVTLRNEREIRRRIEFLMGSLIPGDRIEGVICSFPEVLRFGVEERLKPLLSEFKALGFSEELIRNEIVREPRILRMEIGELSRCLELLRSLKCREAIKE